MSHLEIPELSKTEQDILIEHFKCPVLRKYLTLQYHSFINDLVDAVPSEGQTDTEYIREQERWRGIIYFIKSLLDIK